MAGQTEGQPELRREFVGMMFAIAVGEIGLQAAALVQAHDTLHYLPAYSHLFLAMFVIAASWVGWSRTAVPGAKKDVQTLFELPFVVLLLDMAMVVTYFVLVRTVDFSGESRRIDGAREVAFWHIVIFGLYLIWDIVTKFMMSAPGESRMPFTGRGAEAQVRIAPTVACFALSIALWWLFEDATDELLLTADLSLFCVVMLFRALKGLAPALWKRLQWNTAFDCGAWWSLGWSLGLTTIGSIALLTTTQTIPNWIPKPVTTAIRRPATTEGASHSPQPQRAPAAAPERIERGPS